MFNSKSLLPSVTCATLLVMSVGCSSRSITPPGLKVIDATIGTDRKEGAPLGTVPESSTEVSSDYVSLRKDLQGFFLKSQFRGVFLKKGQPGSIEELNPMTESECGSTEYSLSRNQIFFLLTELVRKEKPSLPASVEGKVKAEFRTRVAELEKRLLKVIAALKNANVWNLSQRLQACELRRAESLNELIDQKVFESIIDDFKAEKQLDPSTRESDQPRRMGGDRANSDNGRVNGDNDDGGFYSDENVS